MAAATKREDREELLRTSEDLDQAFQFIQELEVAEVAATLNLAKAEKEKSRGGLLLGVIEIESRNFF